VVQVAVAVVKVEEAVEQFAVELLLLKRLAVASLLLAFCWLKLAELNLL
jgi:hypothetical protein